MPNPKKNQVIKQMQVPSAKQKLQSFLGTFNYLCQFVPSMSDITTPLMRLLLRGILFNGQNPIRFISEVEGQHQQ